MEVEVEVDLKLVERLRGGDTAALEALMGRYAARVYRVAHGITRNEADAEEVVQDVFLTLFHKTDTFEGRAARELTIRVARVEMPEEMRAILRRFLLERLAKEGP